MGWGSILDETSAVFLGPLVGRVYFSDSMSIRPQTSLRMVKGPGWLGLITCLAQSSIYTFANGWTWANFEAHGESGLSIGLITKQPPCQSDKLQPGPTKEHLPVDNGELILSQLFFHQPVYFSFSPSSNYIEQLQKDILCPRA